MVRLSEVDLVAFDTETSGAYPVGYDIVEFGAVKWRDGKEISRLQFLLKPRETMSDFIIGIHGITNEMVADAPLMKDKVKEIWDFFQGSVIMAHHAPFDLGFICYEFEKYNLDFPQVPVLCTSLLSRKLIHESENHKLQTLVKLLKIDGGNAHRAADDAQACLQVGLECFRRMGESATVAEAERIQGKDLSWKNYSLKRQIQTSSSSLASANVVANLIEAIEAKRNITIAYQKGGFKSGETRQIHPIGIVRNPDGDYLMAKCLRDGENKRFYLSKILEAG